MRSDGGCAGEKAGSEFCRIESGTLSRFFCGILSLIALASCGPGSPESGAPLRPTGRPLHPLTDSEGVLHLGELVRPGSSFVWSLPEAASGSLRFAWSVANGGGGAALSVDLLPEKGEGKSRSVGSFARRFPTATAAAAVLFDEELPLRVPAGGGRLRFRLETPGALFLSDLRVVRPAPTAESVILVVFDTTRADAVGLYGCVDPSTPHLDAVFRGAWKADRAYAAASWTIPSVAALLTGRVPAVHEGPDGSPLGIAPGVETIAADFARAGWSTGAFVANPTVRVADGFGFGFTTFFSTPYEPSSITLPSSRTLRLAPRWIAAHRGEPFFLFLLLLDPHDPYTPPDRPRGFTPFDPHYRGPIVGDEIHRLQIGSLEPPPPEGLRHLKALYHDEVRFADREFGRLWERLEPDRRSHATLVFVSDHGEEFGEHGGWKHGPTLFEEVLRVPFLIRPAEGRRSPPLPSNGPVSLLDVLPTIEELVGLPQPRRPLEGVSLFRPEARQRTVLPPITMLTGGAARAVVVRKASTLFFFDRLGRRGIPDARRDPDGYHLAKQLPQRLPALGRFDFESDPGETRPLPPDPETFPTDWRAIEHAIGGTRKGLELRFLGGASATPLSIEIRGLSVRAAVEPFALEKDDRFSWRPSRSDRRLEARLVLQSDVDGFLIENAGEGDLALTVSSGEACAILGESEGTRLLPGSSVTIPRSAIGTSPPRLEHPANCTGVFAWESPGRNPDLFPPEQSEAWKKLRALGYIH
ncbi:MAG TPA: sulfatase [Thermoanaerobaculia bacterium]